MADVNRELEALARVLLRPPYRCCGVSTTRTQKGNLLCTVCGRRYKPSGEQRYRNNGHRMPFT